MNKKQLFQIASAFIVGILLTVFVYCVFSSQNRDGNKHGVTGIEYLTQDNLPYQFVHPLLDAEYINQEDSLKQFPYMKKIKSMAQAEVDKYPDVKIGFYFNDLSNAGWTGINEQEKFIPASLLKLPMLISYYKLRETEPNLFEEKITYQGNDFNGKRNTDELSTIVPNKTYTVRELLTAMIVNSDNNALELLYQYKKNALRDIFTDLHAPLPDNDNDLAMENFLTPKDLSKFLIVLYNGSYLKKVDSEEALKLLSQVNYRDGLVAGVPRDIVVAHKYGERKVNVGNGNSENELHDCGIIYLPKSPYELCVMTRGRALDIATSSKIISNISKIVYSGIMAGK